MCGRVLLASPFEKLHHALSRHHEGQTDCWALFLFRFELRKVWGPNREQADAAYEIAWRAHQGLPPAYQGTCLREAVDVVSRSNGL